MKINKLNYEQFAIDYLEGKLDHQDKKDFDRFLLDHPEIKAELDVYLMAPVYTEDVSLVYERKESTRKKDTRKHLWLIFFLVGVILLSLWKYGARITSIQEPNKVVRNQTTLPIVKIDGEQKHSEVIDEKDSVVIETKKAAIVINDFIPKERFEAKQKLDSKYVPSIQRPVENISTPHAFQPQEEIVMPISTGTNKFLKTRVEQQTVPLAVAPAQLASVTSLPATAPIPLKEIPRQVQLVVVYNQVKSKRKKPSWRELLRPKTYEDLDLGAALVSHNLKSAAEDTEKAIVPELFITK